MIHTGPLPTSTRQKRPHRGPRLQRMQQALDARGFFKLILGGSFTEADKSRRLAAVYAQAGVDCIDLAPDPEVLCAVLEALAPLPPVERPVLMVSLPLDPDPHFRKIELEDPACIACSACLPVCPTQAITLPERLIIDQDLCYGCGRCVPACPTEALSLLPFQVESRLAAVLAHPAVEAVEIHTRHGDPYMLEALYRRWGEQLSRKLVSLCFRPDEIPRSRQETLIETALRLNAGPVMVQIDGAPMSGTDHPDASLPALRAATDFSGWASDRFPGLAVTVSGGINRHTASHLARPEAAVIAGVGMGTVARQAVWHALGDPDPAMAIETATAIVRLFKQARYPL